MINLTEINTRVRALLDDSQALRFSDNLLGAALGQALEELDQRAPCISIVTHTVTTAGRDQSLPGLTGCRYIISVTVPLEDGSSRRLEPETCFTYLLADGVPALHFLGSRVPAVGDQLLIQFAAGYAIAGYRGALSTTLPVDMETALINGSAGRACFLRAGSLIESYGGRGSESSRWMETGRELLNAFERSLNALKTLQDFGFPPGFAFDRWDGVRR